MPHSPSPASSSATRTGSRARAHPDLYVLEPLGDQIRIDPIRDLRRDLHMRPFEAARRVYLVLGAHLMNEDAADALLKDLEEPPDYAVVVLVADELGPLPPTIRSRCQLVPFRRLSQRAIKAFLSSRGLEGEPLDAFARVAGGRLDRRRAPSRRRGRGSAARPHRARALGLPGRRFDPRRRVEARSRISRRSGRRRPGRRPRRTPPTARSAREAEQRIRRAARGAEREEVLAALDLLTAGTAT